MSAHGIRTWLVKTTGGVSFPFFQTTARDHTADHMFEMLPRKGIGGYLIPVVGGVPLELQSKVEYHNGKAFVNMTQADIAEMWYEDDLPAAQRLQLHDVIQASTTEST